MEPENQSFRNKSGKAQPIRTKFGKHWHVNGWHCSGNFGRNGGRLGQVPRSPSFLCGNPKDLPTGRFSPNLVTKRSSVSRRGIRKTLSKPPKSEIENRSNKHLTYSRLQVMGCTAERYYLLHVVQLFLISEIVDSCWYYFRYLK